MIPLQDSDFFLLSLSLSQTFSLTASLSSLSSLIRRRGEEEKIRTCAASQGYTPFYPSLSISPLSWPDSLSFSLYKTPVANSRRRCSCVGEKEPKKASARRGKERERDSELPRSLSTAWISPHAGSYDRHAAVAFHRVRAPLPFPLSLSLSTSPPHPPG